MKTLFLLILISCFSQFLFAQYSYEETIEKTDSSIITTLTENNYGKESIKIYNELKKKDLIYYLELYIETRTIKVKGKLSKYSDIKIGKWKYFDKTGKLTRIDNYETGRIESYTGNNTITLELNNALDKADSVLISNFGTKFFKNYIRFNSNESDWFGQLRFENNHEYYFVYNISIPNISTHSSITFLLNPNNTFKYYSGFTNCKLEGCDLMVDFASAIDTATARGLKLRKDKYFVELIWVEPEGNTLNQDSKNLNLHISEYYIMVSQILKRKTEKYENGSTTYLFLDAIYLDPWTGAVLKREQIKRAESSIIKCRVDHL